MSDMNPYNAYTVDTILSSNPLGLVVALYEGAIDACAVARACFASRDIPGRTKAINKIVGILTELLRTLNDEKGGVISHNLKRLYAYIQGRVTDAHIRQDAAPLSEVEKLLSTLLEGWKGASASHHSTPERNSAYTNLPATSATHSAPVEEHSYAASAFSYGGYHPDSSFSPSAAYSF